MIDKPSPAAGFVPYRSFELRIGSLILGGNNPVRIQSMTNTPTGDVEATVRQSIMLYEAGSELVRIAVPSMRELEALKKIVKQIRLQQYNFPVIADIHYNPRIALEAAPFVDKIRINPGNYCDKAVAGKKAFSTTEYESELHRIAGRLFPLLQACRKYGTVIRIGANHGSLSERILERYGNTALGMVESAMEFVQICRAYSFDSIVLSMKSSRVVVMQQACRLLAARLKEEGMEYPLHIGVTEAGAGMEGRLRSAAGVGSLLYDGIGDTLRVSLSEDPLNEPAVARAILNALPERTEEKNTAFTDTRNLNNYVEYQSIQPKFLLVCNSNDPPNDPPPDYVVKDKGLLVSSANTCNTLHYGMIGQEVYNEPAVLPIGIDVGVISPEGTHALGKIRQIKERLQELNFNGALFLRMRCHGTDDDTLISQAVHGGGALLENLVQGLWTENAYEGFALLQATGVRISGNEYISCPTCGRTQYDLQKALEEVKKATGIFKGLKIAVMGCMVNGPGELADADFGYVGAGKNKVSIYHRKTLLHSAVPQEKALNLLLAEIHRFLAASNEPK